MSVARNAVRPALHCLNRSSPSIPSHIRNHGVRMFKSASWTYEASVEPTPTLASVPYDPLTVSTPKGEKILMKTSTKAIGSRRRRAALGTSPNIPFEQLPYQCFQDALAILAADRAEKLESIQRTREKIARVREGTAPDKERKLKSLLEYIDKLKILADINDPLVKKRFEDGEGDMNKPIYRHLAFKKFASYRQKLLSQRITQLNLVPDVLPAIEINTDVRLAFSSRKVPPGEFVDSRVSERVPKLNIQVFDKGPRLITIAIVDPDVPDLENDRFNYRCHFLASNIELSPTITSVPLARLDKTSQIILPYLPAFAQKGAPYHRLGIFIMQQNQPSPLDTNFLREQVQRDGFKLRSFNDKHNLKPIGATLFRTVWDEGTKGVMERIGVEGADVVFKRPKVEPLEPVQLPRKRKENRPGLPTKRL